MMRNSVFQRLDGEEVHRLSAEPHDHLVEEADLLLTRAGRSYMKRQMIDAPTKEIAIGMNTRIL